MMLMLMLMMMMMMIMMMMIVESEQVDKSAYAELARNTTSGANESYVLHLSLRWESHKLQSVMLFKFFTKGP